MAHVTVGGDVGQKRDPTAIAVAEPEKREGGYHFVVRYLERLLLGTPYPAVAARVEEIVAGVRSRSDRTPTVYVDATGVGQPVVDLLDTATTGRVVPVYFTYGDRRVLHAGDKIVFTGEEPAFDRQDLAREAEALGLRVTGPVSGRTRLLVAADPDCTSGKARKARDLQVPIVDYATYFRLLDALRSPT